MTDMDRLIELEKEGYCRIAHDTDNNPFIIVDSWKDVKDLSIAMGHEPEDNYDTTVLDELDCDWGFSDEYAICDICGAVVHIQDYNTIDYFIDYDGGYLVCGDCVRKNPRDYLVHLINNPEAANTILSNKDLMDNGFHKVDGEYAAGWYDRFDAPSDILDAALNKYEDGEFIFSVKSFNPFETQYELWSAQDISSLEEKAPEAPIYKFEE